MPDGERGTRQQVAVKYDHGRYYLQVQRFLTDNIKPRLRSPTEPAKVVALDPGIRTFQGVADSAGRFSEIGEAQVERLIRIAKRADCVQSHIDMRLTPTKASTREPVACQATQSQVPGPQERRPLEGGKGAV
jgi:hypothetical protein